MKGPTFALWLLVVAVMLGVTGSGAGQALTEDEAFAQWEQASKLYQAGRYADAERLYRRLLPEVFRLWGEGSTNHAHLLNNLANLYYETSRYAQAEPLFLRSLEIPEARLGKDHLLVAASLNGLANLYHDMGRYAKAEPLYHRSLKIREVRLPGDHLDLAQSLGSLANLYKDMGRYAKAEPLYVRDLAILEAKHKDHLDVARCLNNMALLYEHMGRHEKAEQLHRRSLAIKEAKLGKDHPLVASSLHNLAALYWHMGRYEEAEPLLQHSLQILEAKLPRDHPEVASSLDMLAILYQAMGRFEKAEPLYRRSLEIREAKRKDHPEVARSLHNLANLYWYMGRYEEAEPLFLRSLEIKEAQLDKDHPDAALTLNNLANLYQYTGRYKQAEALYKRSLEIWELKLSKDHPDVAQSQDNLALLYMDMGRYEQAEPLFLRSLEIRETKLSRDHPKVAQSLNNLALLYVKTGRSAQAEPLYRRCLEIKAARFGKDHPEVALSSNNLALLYAGQDKTKSATEHYDRTRRIVRRHAGRVLPLLSEREQLDFFHRTDEANFYSALTLAYRHAADAGLAERSAAWLLNAKGLAQQTRAQTVLAARDSRDPASGEALRELLDVRRQLARLILTPPTAAQEEAHRRQQQQLSQREQDLVKLLQRQEAAVDDADSWLELRQLQEALRSDAVFIDIARFDVCDFQATGQQKHWGPARYVAWLTPKDGPVRVIDLGQADKIDAAVRLVRQALEEAPKRLKAAGESDAEQAARKALDELGRLVLQPLRPHLDGVQRWLICPDGNLWLLPWAALPLDDKTYAVEKHTIQLVVSGRDLLPTPHRPWQTTAPAVFADPDFDRAAAVSRLAGRTCPGSIGPWRVSFDFAEDGKVRIYNADGERYLAGEGSWTLSGEEFSIRTQVSRFTGRLAEGKAAGERVVRKDDGQTDRDRWEFHLPPQDVPEPGLTRGLEQLQLGKVPRLPGTAAEAHAVAQRLDKLFGKPAQVWTEDQATTSAFLALRRPQALVLATHGFFLPDQELSAEERERLARDPQAKPRQQLEDPLLRCGLLLAGCNRASAGGDTGVLTGREVLSADLRGCQMVVLSACETGLGDVRNGEGVAGLRQAFQLAGAASVLASLWQIPDRDTALLMVALMDGLGRGQDRAEALAQAQRQRIAARRERAGAAHPFFWAAFTLTGDAGSRQAD
jgi:tetratricopeptide (TPR) repeat protein